MTDYPVIGDAAVVYLASRKDMNLIKFGTCISPGVLHSQSVPRHDSGELAGLARLRDRFQRLE